MEYTEVRSRFKKETAEANLVMRKESRVYRKASEEQE